MTTPDDPIEPSYHDMMNALAQGLDQILNPDPDNKKVAFTLLISEFGDHGRMNYISNGERSDMLSVMKEFLIKNGEEVRLPKH